MKLKKSSPLKLLSQSSLCLYSSNLGTFWLKIEQFWPLCCLSFFDLRIIITPLVSTISSYKTGNCICQIYFLGENNYKKWYHKKTFLKWLSLRNFGVSVSYKHFLHESSLKGKTTIYKTLHIKLNIEQREPHWKPGVNSCLRTIYV
jgi:hypothetical protein